ncbi:heavy-metal-associated domain-containing protein [Paraburkholderia bryophila]|uniref:Heavy-metal-associated domain-containing protein n=1 Tax=Paraburkholderia bryophila TaxID=420952 RepID=A0A329B9Q4_9BURK|nr:heavy-metal-associated domain-containing protein [Paraburkholderia bryophila]
MEFDIPDMTCGGCANAIKRAVTQLDPGCVETRGDCNATHDC